jgi:DNA-binding NarL/FixJ family response regulator
MKRVSVVVVAPARQRAICRSALAASRTIAIAGEGRRVSEALALMTRHQPAVVVLGNTPRRMPPALAVSALRRRSPGTGVILLTVGLGREAAALEAARRGAQGCLDESVARGYLAKAVRAVTQGEAWFPRGITSEIVRRLVDRESAAVAAGRLS